MPKFLLNANLSPLTQEFLGKTFGYDVKTVKDFGMGKASDDKIVALATKEKRMIITHDLDFAEIYYFGTTKNLGIIVLRLKIQTVEIVNKVLEGFFKKAVIEKYPDALIIVDETKYRIRTRETT